MQDPNEDTEWNDVLRAKGIIPEKPKEKEVTEEDLVDMLEATIKEKTQGKSKEEMTLDELDELEDEEEEKILEEYKQRRIAEIKALQAASKFGDVREISADDYVREVNQAGEGVRVVLHLYKQGIPLCALINQQMSALAAKFPQVKFLKSISTTCIPNYPDRNLPTLFFYRDGQMRGQLVGPHEFRGTGQTQDELEFLLGAKVGALEQLTKIAQDPRPAVRDVMMGALTGKGRDDDSSDENDW